MARGVEFPDDMIIPALKAAGGNVAIAAEKLKMTRPSLSRRIHSSKVLEEVLKEIHEDNLDLAEWVVLSRMKERNLTAAFFYLHCFGRERGWVERTEITGPGGAAVNVRVYLPENKRDEKQKKA